MEISQSLAAQALDIIRSAHTILIISHRNPDADTIGSNLALRQTFEKYGKNVISACIDDIPPGITFLKNFQHYQKEFDLNLVDAIICVDAGSRSQLGFVPTYPELLSGKIPVINIDHHASNDNYGTINLVFPEAASATIVLYFLFQLWGEPITPNMATCLLFGLYYDTGSFMHSNTNEEVYLVGGALIQLGAKLEPIIKNLFHSQSINQLKLWGKIFTEVQLNDKNIAVSGITAEEFKRTNTQLSDLVGAIDYLSMIKGNIFATILSEDGKGHIRGSLRTKKDDINLSELAGLLGGGGHKKASGFSLEGKLIKETKWSIVP